MTRLYGRSELGARCLGAVPHSHWSTATFIAALRHDRLSAPVLFDGPMEGALFLAYVTRVLVPELRRGDIVICDNLSSHKVQGARQAIAACGAELLYLPPYSPDFNPIELAFSKLKTLLRQAAERSFCALLRALSMALAAFPPSDCRNFLRHANYATD
jgi:transposase